MGEPGGLCALHRGRGCPGRVSLVGGARESADDAACEGDERPDEVPFAVDVRRVEHGNPGRQVEEHRLNPCTDVERARRDGEEAAAQLRDAERTVAAARTRVLDGSER